MGSNAIGVVAAFSCAMFALALAACHGNDMDNEAAGSAEQVQAQTSVAFNGQVLRIDIPRADGGTESFNSVRDEWFNWTYAPEIPNHAGRRWTLLKTTRENTSLAYVLISWDNDDPTDYLAAGWWLQFRGSYRQLFRGGLSLANATRSAFVDGPELDPSRPARMPDMGEATYIGSVGGLYQYTYGSDWVGEEGTIASEEISAIMEITADFSENTLSGCVGCIGDIELERAHLYLALGRREGEPSALPTDYELHFNAADIGPGGMFEGTDVAVMHPVRTVIQSGGTWSGRFSNIADPTGNPRLVAGLATAAFAEADGSLGGFEGLYVALGDSLRPPAPSQ